MKIAVAGSDEQFEAIHKNVAPNVLIRMNVSGDFLQEGVDAVIDFRMQSSENAYTSFAGPVFINSVTHTLQQLNAGKNIIRFNGWPGFIEKDILEVSGILDEPAKDVLKTINKKYIVTPDIPGFVSCRIIAMIINEAWHAKGDDISSEADIDTAMKLGTNYPYGPFEWTEKIGLKNLYALLEKLSETDIRFSPAPALISAMKNIL